MIDLFDLYQSFKSYVNTYVGGWFRPRSDFQAACNDISSKLWVKWTDEAEKSQEAKDNLVPFLISKNLIVKQSGAYGTFTVPIVKGKEFEEYGRFSAARIIIAGDACVPCNEVNDGKCSNGDFKSDVELSEDYYDTVRQVDVRMVDNKKWGPMNRHLTKGPTMDNPKIRQINGGFEVAPRNISVIVLDYYRPPKLATLVYTTTPGNIDTGAGDEIQYNAGASKPLEWAPSLRNEFLINLGERYGLFTRDQFVSNVVQQQKATG